MLIQEVKIVLQYFAKSYTFYVYLAKKITKNADFFAKSHFLFAHLAKKL